MSQDPSLCDLILSIQEDPFKKVEGLTIGRFYQLKEHLEECQTCSEIVDKILEQHKNVPDNPNSGWNKVNYN